MVDKEIVAAVRAALAKRIGEARYQLWFGAHTHFVVHDDILQVVTSSIFFLAAEEFPRRSRGILPRNDGHDACGGVPHRCNSRKDARAEIE